MGYPDLWQPLGHGILWHLVHIGVWDEVGTLRHNHLHTLLFPKVDSLLVPWKMRQACSSADCTLIALISAGDPLLEPPRMEP